MIRPTRRHELMSHQKWPWLSIAILIASACGDRAAPEREALSPEHIARNNRGVGLMGRFDFDAAGRAFGALADERPGWLDVHVNLALALMNRQGEGDADRAEQVLRDRVLAADGGHVRGRYALGLLQLYAGRASEAAEAFRRVVEADRDDAFAAYFLAQSLASSGDHAQALDGYRRTIALNPQFRSAYYGAFHALQGAGRESDGASFLKQFQDLETNPQAIVAEFKYTRMGPLGEAATVDLQSAAPPSTPTGPLFGASAPLAAGDVDANGAGELYTLGPTGIQKWERGDDGAWGVGGGA
jgi:tetratricopeptide (TPR) repeat protein